MKRSMWKFIAVLMILGSFSAASIFTWQHFFPVKAKTEQVFVPIKIDLSQVIEVWRPELEPIVADAIVESLEKYADQYNVDPAFVLCLMYRESRLNQLAVSSSGAIGLGQIMQIHHKEKLSGMSRASMFHIDNNVKLTCWVLSDYMKISKTPREALYRYRGCEHVSYANDIIDNYSALQLKAR